MTPEGWLVVVDLQHVFGDAGLPWGAPRFADVRPRIRRLVEAFGDRVVLDPVRRARRTGRGMEGVLHGHPFALQPPDAPLYGLVEDPGAHPVADATMFGKWGPDLVV